MSEQDRLFKAWWPDAWELATGFLPMVLPPEVERLAQKIARAAFAAGYAAGVDKRSDKPAGG